MLRLDRLALGDVAAVVRQYELWDETPTAAEFYRRLTVEVATKSNREAITAPVRPERRSTAAMY